MRNTPASIRNVGGFLNSLKSARDSIARCTNLIRASLNPNLYSSSFKGIFLRENTGFSHGTPEREALPVTTASPQFASLPPHEHHLAGDWRAFDRIYCISLNNRPDRYETARTQFKRVGLGDLVEVTLVDKHPSNSEHGIFESHMACLRAGLAAGAERIAIFEDDIIFSRFSPERLRRAVRFMESDSNWQIFFFGCFVNSSHKTQYRSVVKVCYRCCAHGYVVSRQFARKLVESPWQNIAYDDLLRSLGTDGAYAVYPGFAFQSASATDNDKLRGVDRARRLFGGLQRLQQWNEFSSRRFVPLIVGHFIVSLMVVLIFLRHYGAHWGAIAR
jgi:GR25 family glycosyltransferase involved in LPS biosynthesis